jgi:hypothetical protein
LEPASGDPEYLATDGYQYPARETALMTGDIGFRQHSAGHTPNPNWVYFLDLAAKYWDAKPGTR